MVQWVIGSIPNGGPIELFLIQPMSKHSTTELHLAPLEESCSFSTCSKVSFIYTAYRHSLSYTGSGTVDETQS